MPPTKHSSPPRRTGLRGLSFRALIKLSFSVSVCASTTPFAHSDGTTYSTGLAQIRIVPFPDHTLLRMDAKTSLLIKEGSERRTIYLETGQIQASLQHGQSKPLDVIVDGVFIRDVGTAFDIAAHDGAVTVSVTSGTVQVTELHSDGSQVNPITIKEGNASRIPTFLTPGDLARLERREETILVTREANSPEEAQNRTSWVGGHLQTKHQRLDDVLWELNSRNKVHLVTADSTVAQMTLGGSYNLMRVDDFLGTVRDVGIAVTKIPEKDGFPTYVLSRLPDAPSATKHRS